MDFSSFMKSFKLQFYDVFLSRPTRSSTACTQVSDRRWLFICRARPFPTRTTVFLFLESGVVVLERLYCTSSRSTLRDTAGAPWISPTFARRCSESIHVIYWYPFDQSSCQPINQSTQQTKKHARETNKAPGIPPEREKTFWETHFRAFLQKNFESLRYGGCSSHLKRKQNGDKRSPKMTKLLSNRENLARRPRWCRGRFMSFAGILWKDWVFLQAARAIDVCFLQFRQANPVENSAKPPSWK